MQFVIEHSQSILVTALLLSEAIGIWTPAGGIIDAVIKGLKLLGAKEPGAQ